MADIAASVLAKLRNKAKASGISYQQCLQLFVQEEFLRKLSKSGYEDTLILKGGLFIYTLTNFESRATIDVDFLLRGYSNAIDDVKSLICKIIDTPTGNDYIEMRAKGFEEISPQRKYHGISTQIIAQIKNVRVPFNVDIGVGDIIVPRAEERTINTQLPDFEAPVIKTYSLESTIAEKFDAILQRFELTGRMKDFYDIYYLSRTFDFEGAKLQAAIFETLQRRGTPYDRDSFKRVVALADDEDMQKRWKFFLKTIKDNTLEFPFVIEEIQTFLEPVFDAIVNEKEWQNIWKGNAKKWSNLKGGGLTVTRAVNDATLQKAGDIYQYLIALRDCFELNDGDTLQIETNGDVSIINDVGGRFQREVKHHFGNTSISDRDIDFWKTLANWYVDYERVKNFSNYILSTTATIKSDSPFHSWNNIKKTEKLKCLKDIGATSKKTEETFRNQYNRIFGDSYDESRLLEILDKFTIEAAKTSIDGISNEFSKYVGHIPSENRDGYIGALLGEILIKVKEPPHKWEVTKSAFDEILQIQSAAYGTKGTAPLPNEYAKAVVPKDKITTLEQKKFVASIREIKYDKMIPNAMSDYWKADLTVAKYFRDNLMYLESLESYMEDLSAKMQYSKANSDLNAEGATEEGQIRISKQLYNGVMSWDANDFGSIIRNQGYFQRGVIHNIVDETDFKWKVGEEKNEHK